ncbi:MAG: IclR family transcriptional regulator [Allobranchiibius sp.]
MSTPNEEPALSTTEKVALLILAFELGPGGVATDRSVSELARAVGRERTQVSRMLASLRRTGIVEQDADSNRYRLGWRIRVMAAGAGDQLLVNAARPVLQTVVARTGEVALLSVQEANRSLTVMRQESQNTLQGGGWIGRRSAMHYSASGRALLFDSDDEVVEALTAGDLGHTLRSGPAAPTSLQALLQKLREERRHGYSVASEELEVGLTSIGAPVRDGNGHIVAVVNVSGPTPRIINSVDTIGRLLVTASGSISHALRKMGK